MRHLNKFAMVAVTILSVQALALTVSTKFADVQKLWETGTEISTTDVTGTWKKVAVFEHQDCQNVMQGSAFDRSGVKNSDGSVFTLSFEGHQVAFLNIGNHARTQGPYEVADRNVAFSSWAYNDGEEQKGMTDQAYGFYRCRQVADAKDELLCAVGARLAKGADSDPVFEECSAHATGFMVLFTKNND